MSSNIQQIVAKALLMISLLACSPTFASTPTAAANNSGVDLAQVDALAGQNNSNNPSIGSASNPAGLEAGAYVAPSQGRLWTLQNADIRSVIDEISRETGKNFIVDPRVQGNISIVSSTPLTNDEVYQVFLSALQVLGYSAIPTGQIIKIVPNSTANSLGATVGSSYNQGTGDQIIARVIPLQNVSADLLAPLLRPLLPDWANLSSYASTNVLIAVGPAQSVKRLAEIAAKVDVTNTNGIDLISLHYVSAIDVANTIQSLQSTEKADGTMPDVSVAADAASNSILLSGNKNARLKMRVLISELDAPTAAGTGGNTQVIYLHYLRAQDLVPILAGVAESYYRGPVGTVIGTRSQIGTDYASINNPSDDGQGSVAASPSESSGTAAATPAASPVAQPQQAQTTESDTNSADDDKPKIELIAEPNTNSIIINAPPMLMHILKNVITQLDIQPAEILVQALIAEVDQQTACQLGIQWGAITPAGSTGVLTPNNATTAFQAGIGLITGQGIHDLQGVITALQQNTNNNILSTPSVLVLDNHQAKIEVGQEVSVQASTYPGNAGGTTTASPYSTYQREKVTLHLYVTPQINQNNSLLLSIDQGNDTLQNPEDATSTTPVFNISSIKTSILVDSGNIIVLGGLIQNQYGDGTSGLPVLSNIPILGHLFRTDNTNSQKKDLMVFLRPIIVSKPGDSTYITQAKYNFARQEMLRWLQQTPRYEFQPIMNQTVPPSLNTKQLVKPFPQIPNTLPNPAPPP